MTLTMIALVTSAVLSQTAPAQLSLDRLTAADDATARTMMTADPAGARAVFDELIARFDKSIHSDRDSPEQRRVEYDADALTAGLRLADLFSQGAGGREDWRRFEARRLRIEGTRLLNDRRYGAALEQLSLALAEAEALGDRWLETITRINMVYGLVEEGQPAKALAQCERANDIAATLDERARALTRFNLTSMHLHLRNYEKVIELSQPAIESARRVGIKIWEGNGELNLGFALWMLGRTEEAAVAFERSLTVLNQTQDRLGQGRALFNLGLVTSALGRYAQAAEYLERALPIIRDVDIRHSHEIELDPDAYQNPVELAAHEALAGAYRKAGNEPKAAEHDKMAHDLRARGVPKPHGHDPKP